MREAAYKSCRAVGFDIGGSDVIEAEEEPYVLEVNGSFGISEEMNEIIGEDVILKMIERMHERALEKKRKG